MRPCPPIQDALRRGNPPLSLHRTPPRPSGDPRKHAGTLSRRPPYSNFARMCKVAAKAPFSLIPGAARSLFGADKKRMGGASPVETAPWREPDSPSHGTHHQPTIDKGSKL